MKTMEKTLDQQIAQLQKQIYDYHPRIVSTQLITEKRTLIKQRTELSAKLTPLLRKKEAQQEKEHEQKLEQFLLSNRHLIGLTINGNIIPIPKNLHIELACTPCGHKKRIHIKELLRTYSHHAQKRVPSTNQQLYDQWQMLFDLNYTQPNTETCQTCRKERNEQRNKFHHYQDKPIGTVRWELHKLR